MMFVDPQVWWLELSPTLKATVIPQSQQCSTPYSRHWAYLNGLCLQACLDWLREDLPTARPAISLAQLPHVSEVVNGTAIVVGNTRLILIPSDAIDISELVVPQEWVDIPSWAGDYYLAVQVHQEQGWMRVWGYATHAELKESGTYDASDRTYGLDADQLTQDLSALSVSIEFCGTEQTRAEIAPLPELPAAQAHSLIQRLGQAGMMFPRLAIPFPLWGTLIEHDTWREQLWQHRLGRPAITATVTRLSDWFQGTFTTAWQALEGIVAPPEPAIRYRNRATVSPESAPISRVRVLDFGSSSDRATVALILQLAPLTASSVAIDLQIYPTADRATLPQPVQLQLRDGSGQPVTEASAAATETIELQLEGEYGQQFQVVVTVGENQVVETFEI